MTQLTVPEFQHRTVLLDEAVDALDLTGDARTAFTSMARLARRP